MSSHHLTDSEDELITLVSSALKQDRLSGLTELLSRIAGQVDAFGCILWETAPVSSSSSTPPKGTLYVLAEWFRDGSIAALHDLPLDRSLTGSAILTGITQWSINARQDSRVHWDEFLERTGIDHICSIPTDFLDQAQGALSVYVKGREFFNQQEIRWLEHATRLLPFLYQTIREKVSFGALHALKEVFDKAEHGLGKVVSDENMNAVLQAACELVARTFDCIETSIYLEHSRNRPGVYELRATTWPEWVQALSYSKEEVNGLTPWVMRNGADVRIFDLRHFERDIELIQEDYPGITWARHEPVQAAVREYLRFQGLPPVPLSFMASPIRAAGSVVGAIRCFAAKGPYFFAKRESHLLNLIANQIGQRWENWISRQTVEEENQSWRALNESIANLNLFVYRELTQKADEAQIFNKALEVTQSVIRGAEITDVRLVDENEQYLFFAATFGDLWDKGDLGQIRERKERRFPIDRSNPASAGVYVLVTGNARTISNVDSDSYYKGTFPDTRQMILAPIRVEDKAFGVLDIRSTGTAAFPPHAESIAVLLGRQLGLYHYLASTISRLRQTEAHLSSNIEQLERLQQEQSQAYEDLTHQLRSPIIQAHQRIQSALKQDIPEDLGRRLRAARGLCAKAKRVAMSTGLFVDLARAQPIRLRTARLEYHELAPLLIEAARDAEIMIDPDKRIQFVVDRESFKVLRYLHVDVDIVLMEQAISNIFDNAAKYSFPDTEVRVAGGITGRGKFFLGIANKGITLSHEEARQARRRAWRSPDAQMTTGEGSGIGLWIVDHIMKAHRGELIIAPTDLNGWTEIRLIFQANPREDR